MQHNPPPSLSRAGLIQSAPYQSISLRSIVIFSPSNPRFSKSSLSFRLPHKYPTCNSPLPYTLLVYGERAGYCCITTCYIIYLFIHSFILRSYLNIAHFSTQFRMLIERESERKRTKTVAAELSNVTRIMLEILRTKSQFSARNVK
jgi:hypothetical protein